MTRVDEATRALPEETRRALAMSSSRIGAAMLITPRKTDVLVAAGGLSPLATLLVAHHVMPGRSPLFTTALAEMAPYGAAAWPLEEIGRVVPKRNHENFAVLTEERRAALAEAVTIKPFALPLRLLNSAVALLSLTEERPLGEVADTKGWFG